MNLAAPFFIKSSGFNRADHHSFDENFWRKGYTHLIGSMVTITAEALIPSEKDGLPTSAGMLSTKEAEDHRICLSSSCMGHSFAFPRKRLEWNHSFQRPTAKKSTRVARAGFTKGRLMRQKICKGFAPSRVADSSRSGGSCSKNYEE